MDRQKLEERLSLLKQQRDQAKANAYAFDGAIQECEYWLGAAIAEEEKSKLLPMKKEA